MDTPETPQRHSSEDESFQPDQGLFEGKDDEALLKRLEENIEALRTWVVEHGAKPEPVLPESVTKIDPEISLANENFYFRFGEDAGDPYAFWAIDVENEAEAYGKQRPALRVIKDSEVSLHIVDAYYPSSIGEVMIGTTIFKRNDTTGKVQTVSMPARKISQLSGQEIQHADYFIKNGLESVTTTPRGEKNVTPVFRRLSSK